ncbi:beta-1,3-galactosyltransferase 2-like [Takifugu flavidus]|uniref:Hexosyltransferase n=1 Tax=Takifugu flavidus TaxID=433684 RepID=A0A5C6MV93_9TELE|nr:beta-1,3-galactosyltransferase 2-like [Takifugu flavidus]TWW58956.1 Beta-1,3-galactosyltransferase 1 [Takifugu flavidus]
MGSGMFQALIKRWRRNHRKAVVGVLGAASLLLLYCAPELQSPGSYYVAYPGNYTFVISDTPACKNSTPFLLLVVPVAPSGRAARDAIRKTWGSKKLVLGQLVETLFMLGLSGGADASKQQEELRRESRQYRDLVQSDFLDSYRNLTIKTMMTLEWLATNCPRTSYVMKADSDVFLHVKNLVRLLLDSSTAKHNYMTGLVWWHSKVLRDPFNKFYMPRHVVPEPEYPPYPLGMSYVMSMDLPAKILGVSPQLKAVFIEDVYLGMCLKRLGIHPTDPPKDTLFLVDPRHPLSDCSLSKLITTTTKSILQMVDYWQRIREAQTKSGNMCLKSPVVQVTAF